MSLVALLFGMGMYSMFAFLPQFLQTPDGVTGYGFDASVTQSGLMLNSVSGSSSAETSST